MRGVRAAAAEVRRRRLGTVVAGCQKLGGKKAWWQQQRGVGSCGGATAQWQWQWQWWRQLDGGTVAAAAWRQHGGSGSSMAAWAAAWVAAWQ